MTTNECMGLEHELVPHHMKTKKAWVLAVLALVSVTALVPIGSIAGDNEGFEIELVSQDPNMGTIKAGVAKVLVGSSTYYLLDNGELYGVGYNKYGQLANDTTDDSTVPVRIGEGLGTVVDACVGANNVFFLTSNGELYGAGYNAQGNMGGNLTTNAKTPVRIGENLGNVTKVVACDYSTCFLTSDGKLYVTGIYAPSQVTYSFIQIGADRGTIVDVEVASQVVYFITSDGELFGLGINSKGNLGDGTTSDSTVPVRIGPTLGAITKVVVNQTVNRETTAYFLTSDGELYGTGYNKSGQLGNGTTTDSKVPVRIGEGLGTVVDVVASHGVGSMFFLTSDGKLYGTGYNRDGQLGNGTTTDSNVPVRIGEGLGTVVDVVVGHGWSAYFLTSDGELYGTGRNTYGEVSGQVAVSATTPRHIGENLPPVCECWASGDHRVVFKTSDEMIYGLGRNERSVFGESAAIEVNVPLRIDGDWMVVSTPIPADNGPLEVSVASNVLSVDGHAYYADPNQGYMFDHWSEIPQSVTGQTTVYASFREITYDHTVSYAANGGTGAMADTVVTDTVSGESEVTLAGCGFTKAGFRFTGWKVGTTVHQPGDKVSVAGDASVTAVAQWQEITYTHTVLYDANGGTGNMNGTVLTDTFSGDSEVTLAECGFSAPARMRFAGWMVGGTVYQPGDPVPVPADGSVTAVAQWELQTYGITFEIDAPGTGKVLQPSSVVQTFVGNLGDGVYYVTADGALHNGDSQWDGIGRVADLSTDGSYSKDLVLTEDGRAYVVSTDDVNATPDLVRIGGTLGTVAKAYNYTSSSNSILLMDGDGALYLFTGDDSFAEPVRVGPGMGPVSEVLCIYSMWYYLTSAGELYRQADPASDPVLLTGSIGPVSEIGCMMTGDSVGPHPSGDIYLLAGGRLYHVGQDGQVARAAESLEGITDLCPGYDNVFLLTGDGELYGLGSNSYQMISPGVNSYDFDTTVPVRIGGSLGAVTDVKCNEFTVAFRTADGAWYAQGNQIESSYVDPEDRQDLSWPVRLAPDLDIADIRVGFTTLVLDSCGNLYGLGYNSNHEISDADEGSVYSPIRLNPEGTAVDAFAFDPVIGWHNELSRVQLPFLTSDGDLYVRNGSAAVHVAWPSSEAPDGAEVSVSSNVLTVGGAEYVAVPATGYVFDHWSEVPSVIDGPLTVTATFSVAMHTVTFVPSDPACGTVSVRSLTVPYGTAITVDGATVTVGDAVVTASSLQDTAQYEYSFTGWDAVGGTVTGDATFTAGFARELRSYEVSVEPSDPVMGTVVGPNAQVEQIVCENATFFRTSDGKVYVTGPVGMFKGLLGDTDLASPVRVAEGLGPVADVSVMYSSVTVDDVNVDGLTVYLLTEAGALYGGGFNGHGQLGNGTTSDSTGFVRIGDGLGTVADVCAIEGTVFVLNSDGEVYGFGYCGDGERIPGDEHVLPSPVRVFADLGPIDRIKDMGGAVGLFPSSGGLYVYAEELIENPFGEEVIDVNLDVGEPVVAKSDGLYLFPGQLLRIWQGDGRVVGLDGDAYLVLSGGTLYAVPVDYSGSEPSVGEPEALPYDVGTVVDAVATDGYFAVLNSDGEVWTNLGFGENGAVALDEPVRIAEGKSSAKLYMHWAPGLFVVDSEGVLAYGFNEDGMLGAGSAETATEPVRVLGTEPSATNTYTYAYGTAVSAESDVLTIGDRTFTATPAEGCVFNGWSALPDSVTGTLTVTASFGPASVSVVLTLVDGDDSSEIEGSAPIGEDAEIVIDVPDPEMRNKRFLGWAEGPEGPFYVHGDTVAVPAGGLTLDAQWKDCVLTLGDVPVWYVVAGKPTSFRAEVSSDPVGAPLAFSGSRIAPGLHVYFIEDRVWVEATSPGTYTFVLTASADGYDSDSKEVTVTAKPVLAFLNTPRHGTVMSFLP